MKLLEKGTVCFATVSYSLSCSRLQLDDQQRLFIHQKGIKVGTSATEMVKILRQLEVNEWTDNSHHYEPFLTNSTLPKKQSIFLITAHFQSDLGDVSC